MQKLSDWTWSGTLNADSRACPGGTEDPGRGTLRPSLLAFFCLAVVSDISPGLKLHTVWNRWWEALRPLKMDFQGTPGTQAGLLSTELGHPSPCMWKTR